MVGRRNGRVVRLPGHDLLERRVELSTKESVRAAGVGDQRRGLARRSRRGWLRGRAVLRQEAGLVTLRVGIHFLARRKKWDEKGC